jgi:tetratricopeptide (TPR) repeat protein
MHARFLAPAVPMIIAAAALAAQGADAPPEPYRLSEAFAGPAPAQEVNPEPPKPIEPPSTLPRVQGGDKTQNLDRLFEALKVAPDDESAKFVENRIWAIWLASTSDTANLLMGRAKTALDGKDYDLAIKLLDAVVDIKPDFAEAWNRRATVHYTKKDFGRAMADIREVLVREPRHFGALSGLGIILQELGDDRRALDAFRRALAVHPKLERIPDLAKRLTEKIEGRGI